MSRDVELGLIIRAKDGASAVLHRVGTSYDRLKATGVAAMAALAKAPSLVNHSLEIMGKAWRMIDATVGSAVRAAYEHRSASDAQRSAIADLSRSFLEAKRALGDVLLPVLAGMSAALRPALESVTGLATASRDLLAVRIGDWALETGRGLMAGATTAALLATRAWRGLEAGVHRLVAAFMASREAMALTDDQAAKFALTAAKHTRQAAEATLAQSRTEDSLDGLAESYGRFAVAATDAIGKAVTATPQLATATKLYADESKSALESLSRSLKDVDEFTLALEASMSGLRGIMFTGLDEATDLIKLDFETLLEALPKLGAQAVAKNIDQLEVRISELMAKLDRVAARAKVSGAPTPDKSQATQYARDQTALREHLSRVQALNAKHAETAKSRAEMLGTAMVSVGMAAAVSIKTAFGELAAGTATAGEAAIAVTNSVLEAIFAASMQVIAIVAGTAAAKAFEAQQSIPLIGIALGIAAAATALTTVLAFAAATPKPKSVRAMAAGGLVTGGIPGRDSVRALLEPGEFVVPRVEVDRQRAAARQPAPVAPTINVGLLALPTRAEVQRWYRDAVLPVQRRVALSGAR